MCNLLILDVLQRVQRLIPLIPRLSRFRQRTREFGLSLFLRFRELGSEAISHSPRAMGSTTHRYVGRLCQGGNGIGNY